MPPPPRPRLPRLIAILLVTLPPWSAGDPQPSPGAFPAPPAATENRPILTQLASRSAASVYEKTPRELEHKDVLGSKGERLGRIGAIVRARHDGRIHVVIIRGGFMGLPVSEHIFPLHALTLRDGSLRLPVSEAQLRAGETYPKDAYIDVKPKDRPVGEFSGFEGTEPRQTR